MKARDGATHLADLHMAGSLKVMFPRGSAAAKQAVLVNTAGGVTGGDSVALTAELDAGSTLTLTTQAAERAYRALPGDAGQIDTQINASTR